MGNGCDGEVRPAPTEGCRARQAQVPDNPVEVEPQGWGVSRCTPGTLLRPRIELDEWDQGPDTRDPGALSPGLRVRTAHTDAVCGRGRGLTHAP